MKNIIISVQYNFDKQSAWQESCIKTDTIWINEWQCIHEMIKNHIEQIDYIEFTKAKFETEMYMWEWKQCGFIYRFYTDIDDKKYRWECWVTIHWELKEYEY